MKVQARFYVTAVTHFHNGSPGADQAGEVKLQPVYAGKDGNPANAEWSKYTPSGEIKMTITNPAALAAFAPGQNFKVEFTPDD